MILPDVNYFWGYDFYLAKNAKKIRSERLRHSPSRRRVALCFSCLDFIRRAE
jgi:hypothetical protein